MALFGLVTVKLHNSFRSKTKDDSAVVAENVTVRGYIQKFRD